VVTLICFDNVHKQIGEESPGTVEQDAS